MQGKIFIGGGGDIDVSKSFDEKFFGSLPDGSKILYIPWAMGTTTSIIERCYDWFSGLVSGFNESKEIDFEVLSPEANDIDLSKFNAVYVGGGNTYRLLHLIKERGLDNKIADYVHSGGVYYGGSAGGIILGMSLSPVSEESSPEFNKAEGLNLLNGFSVSPHFEKSNAQQVKDIAIQKSLNILAIPEDSGVILENGTMVFTGGVIEFRSNEK